MSEEPAMFSRPRFSDPAGKLTQRIDVPVSEELYERIGALAQLEGYSGKAEYVRAVLDLYVYGKFESIRRLAQRQPEGNR